MIAKSTVNYLANISIRLLYMKKTLKDTGSIYLHCDPTCSHYLKILLDYIYGINNFRNEIVWCYTGPSAAKKTFPKKHDIVFFYTKTNNYNFNSECIRIPYTKLNKQGKKAWTENADIYIEEQTKKGKIIEDYWNDIALAIRSSKENLGYPTQKPEALLERIILASSNEGDLVADFYLGGGTTAASCKKLNRNFIGCDINVRAIEISRERLV